MPVGTPLDPAAVARHGPRMRELVAVTRPWTRSTGPRTAAGKRQMAGNATKHGAGGLAMRASLAYCRAVTKALGAR